MIDIIFILIILAWTAFLVTKMIKDQKKGKTHCGCGCGDCGNDKHHHHV